MKHQVTVRQQVLDFARTLGMTHRRDFKKAILGLAAERGDIMALHDELAGWHRLRVGSFRVIFRYRPGLVIECVYAEERKLVYEVFENEMVRILGREP